MTAKAPASEGPDNTGLHGDAVLAASLLSGIVAAAMFSVIRKSSKPSPER